MEIPILAQLSKDSRRFTGVFKNGTLFRLAKKKDFIENQLDSYGFGEVEVIEAAERGCATIEIHDKDEAKIIYVPYKVFVVNATHSSLRLDLLFLPKHWWAERKM